MSKFILLFATLIFTQHVFGQGDLSAHLKAQGQAAKLNVGSIQVPNNQATKTGSVAALIETGNKNILVNPSFEHSTVTTGWTNSSATFSAESSIVVDGVKALKIVTSSQIPVLTQDSTLYAAQFADGVQGLASCRIKSDVALNFCSRSAGVSSSSNCVTVNADNKWGHYKLPMILGGTSNGLSLSTAGSITGTTYVDDCFVGATDLKQDIDQSRIAGESYFAGTTSCLWSRTSTTVGAFTADSDCPGPTIVTSNMGTWATTDANLPRQTITDLPAGKYTATFMFPNNHNTTGTPVFAINDGTTTCEPLAGNSSTSNVASNTLSCTFNYASSGTRVFELYAASTANQVDVGNGITSPRASVKFILEYFGSGQIYSASCGANCVDTFSAKVSSAGVVSDENVDWINGNAGITSTSVYTMTFNAGIFTSAPNCTVVNSQAGTNIFARLQGNATSSQVVVTTVNNSWALAATDFNIICQKASTDFVATRTIVGSFKGPRSEVHVSGGSGHGSTNNKIRRFTTTVKSIGSDITNSGDIAASGHSFTINTEGIYAITYCDANSTAGQPAGVSVNSNQLTTNIASITESMRVGLVSNPIADNAYSICFSSTVNLSQGDIVRAHTNGLHNATSAYVVNFRIVKVSN